MWHLRGIFVSGRYLAVMCEVAVAGGCVLVHMCRNVWSVFPFSVIIVWFLLAMWQPYLFSDMSNMHIVTCE